MDRRFALNAGEVVAPRLKIGFVQGISRGTNLKDDGVDVQLGAAIENGDGLGLLFVGRFAGLGRPVNIANGGDPSATKFAGAAGGSSALGMVVSEMPCDFMHPPNRIAVPSAANIVVMIRT